MMAFRRFRGGLDGDRVQFIPSAGKVHEGRALRIPECCPTPVKPCRRPGQRRSAEPHARGNRRYDVRPQRPFHTGRRGSSGRILQPQQLARAGGIILDALADGPPWTTIGSRTISSRERSGPGRPRRGPARRSSRRNPSPRAGDRFHTRGGCAVTARPGRRERPRRNRPQNP